MMFFSLFLVVFKHFFIIVWQYRPLLQPAFSMLLYVNFFIDLLAVFIVVHCSLSAWYSYPAVLINIFISKIQPFPKDCRFAGLVCAILLVAKGITEVI